MHDDTLGTRTAIGILCGGFAGLSFVGAMDWSVAWMLLTIPLGAALFAALFWVDPLGMRGR